MKRTVRLQKPNNVAFHASFHHTETSGAQIHIIHVHLTTVSTILARARATCQSLVEIHWIKVKERLYWKTNTCVMDRRIQITKNGKLRKRERDREKDINQGKEVSPHRHRATPLCHPWQRTAIQGSMEQSQTEGVAPKPHNSDTQTTKTKIVTHKKHKVT